MVGQSGVNSGGQRSANNSTLDSETCASALCSHPNILPDWYPKVDTLPIGTRIGRGVVLMVALIYVFLGLSIVADKFYGAIDIIVSKKRRVKIISRVTGTPQYVTIPYWNETVAHLTLFVLGTSAPEILLTVIEVVVSDFQVGLVGPMVILGSAFNLFITAGICVLSVKDGSKRIEEVGMCLMTACWAVFAYVWLYLILGVISNGVIQPWEAILTTGFFPIMVVFSYLFDRRFFGFFKRCCRNKIRPRRDPRGQRSPSADSTTSLELEDVNSYTNEEVVPLDEADEIEAAKLAAEERQTRFLTLVKEMRAKHPNKTSGQVQELAELEIIKEMPKSMGYYRMLAAKNVSGGGDIINKEKLRQKFENNEKKFEAPNQQIISFDPAEYRVMEDCGTFDVHVVRDGSQLNNTISIDYQTEDGTGVAGSDYETVKGTLVFKPGEKLKNIEIEIIDDDVFNLDTQFYVILSNPQVVDPVHVTSKEKYPVLKVDTSKATVTKIDDDHGGVFGFEKSSMAFEEDIGDAAIKVVRNSGAKGIVALPYRIIPETAKPGHHYEEPTRKQLLIFQSHQTDMILKLKLLNEERLTKHATLRIELAQPFFYEPEATKNKSQDAVADALIETSLLGKPKLGEHTTVILSITENAKLKKTVEGLASLDLTEFIGATSWKQQFVDAVKITASSGTEEGEEGGEANDDHSVELIEHKPSCKDWTFHILMIFWKVVCAFIPPSNYWGGWAGFMVALVLIGLLMGLAGDIAIILGCTMGMRIELTAITLIALGVSLPDMFASRLAAIREESADAAIGHMNGRIAVSVFVGIGLSWSIAAIKQAIDGNDLYVPVKSLSFTIVLFFVFSGIVILTFILRRLPPIRGELGGPRLPRICTGVFFFVLWVLYVVLSALDSYCIISTF